jgi:hypothetical protein
MRKSRLYFGATLVLFFLGLAANFASAHPVQFTILQIKVESDGKFRAMLNIDILAYALHKTSESSTNEELQTLLDGPRSVLAKDLTDAGERFRHEVVVRTDVGDALVSSWKLPGLAEVDAILAQKIHPSILMPGEIDFSGTLPPNARTLSIRLPFVLGDTARFYELPQGESFSEAVPAGGYSSNVEIEFQSVKTLDLVRAFGRFAALGFMHMIPDGLDHTLFVLSLFLLSNRLVSLLWQTAVFTTAHSLSLWLSVYDSMRLPPSITQSLIAVSIFVIAIENLFSSELKPWRLLVIFIFGIIHGLDFATAFERADFSPNDTFIGLIGFNVGLECGQLGIFLLAFLAIGWFRSRTWYRIRIVIPTSCVMAFTASIWMIHRIVWPS